MKIKYIDPYLFFDEDKISESSIFVEVGSITGKHALDLKLKYPKSKVIVYEASILTYNELNRRIGNKIKVINKIVSDKKGKSVFYEYNSKSSNSIYNREGTNKKIINKYELETVSIKDILIENNLSCIDVLFLNCEGAELNILNDCLDNNLFYKVHQISVSFHPQIYSKEKMNEIIDKITKNDLEYITDNRKYFNYLLWKRT